MIRRRHVFYVEGYDPQGADGYYRLFRREWRRFLKTWSIDTKLGELSIDSEELAHWDVESAGPNWKVATRYEFCRQEGFIRKNLAEPLSRQFARALRWMLDDLLSGTLLRIFRAAWRFGLHLLYAQGLLLSWIAAALAGGALGYVAGALAGAPDLVALIIAAAVGIALIPALRPVADRWFVTQVVNGWPYLREFARGLPTGYDPLVEAFAARLVEAARANEADEIVVVSHSAGGTIGPIVMARALELDPDVGRCGPPLVLLTVGSLMPAFALHPAAERLRAAIRRIATEPSVLWIDCQARKDVMNFWDFDPVDGVGVHVGALRCNPLIWSIRFRDMLSDQTYHKLRFSYFRMHYQFIMGNDLRAPYDYFMLVCGPVAVADWARRGDDIVKEFSSDGAYVERVAAPVPG